MAGRVSGELVGVHVAVDDGLTHEGADALSAQRRLVSELGGTAHEVVGHDTAEALAAFARREKATQLVVGASRRSRWHELIHGSFVARVTRLAGEKATEAVAKVLTKPWIIESSMMLRDGTHLGEYVCAENNLDPGRFEEMLKNGVKFTRP